MKKIFVMTIILCILHSILLVNQSLGINVILFTIPLLGTILYFLKENNSIKNRLGLLLIIPIVLLSSTYFIYSNFFNKLNIVVIPFLYLLLYVITLDKAKTLLDVFTEPINIAFRAIDNIGCFFRESMQEFPKNKISPNTKKIIKSLLIITPVVIIVLILLISADEIFGSLFKNLDVILTNMSFGNIIVRIFYFTLLFFYLGGTLYYVSLKYKNDKRERQKHELKDSLTISLLLTILNIIYIVFDIIQINSLLLHRVSSGFNYANYARSGFFQLMFISFINLIIILLSKKSKEKTYVKIMSLLTIVLTLVIIVSSFYRMFLYEQAYGYTVLRLGVYIILITEVILLIPTIFYIFNKKVKIVSYYLLITIAVYSLVNCFSIERIIAENNIKRYERTGKIDLYYLENYNYDNLNQLRELRKKINEDGDLLPIEKESFRSYIEDMDKRNEFNILEFNISKYKAKKED